MVNDWEQRMNNSYKTRMFNEYGVPLEIKTGKAIHNNYERELSQDNSFLFKTFYEEVLTWGIQKYRHWCQI